MISRIVFVVLVLCINVVHAGEVRCLASTIWHEARGEPHTGKIAVAKVVLNRKNHSAYPKTVCGVVSQKGQFSWVSGKRIPIRYTDEEYAIAKDVHENHQKYNHILANDVLFFQVKGLKYNWQHKKLLKVKTIGNHNFYRHKKRYDR